MPNRDSPLVIFIVDTDQYSGNFERELVAHMTGIIGDCEVGSEEAKLANKELPKFARDWFEGHVQQVADENGCYRPAALWPTPGWFNDGHGNNHREDADPKKVARLRDKAVEDYAKEVKKIYADKDYAKKDADRFRKQNAGETHKYPAYQSVACFLNVRPPPKILKLLKDRCATFKGRFGTTPTITGFRVQKRHSLIEDVAV